MAPERTDASSTPDEDVTESVVEAASASSERTAAAIEHAADVNDDPEVASILDDASTSAHATVSRVGWLRTTLRRLFGRD
jgi:hypothetical protein